VIPDAASICLQHLDFMVWADNQLFDAVRKFMPHRQEILLHIFMAEQIWLARLEGNFEPRHLEPPAALETAWPELHRRWQSHAAQTDWSRIVAYKTLAGVESSSPVWQIVLHVSNHGSYHRGQVAAMLRAENFTPPSTDLIAWYRQQPTL
jgi:uncharacterized damage-inducible protein DinB